MHELLSTPLRSFTFGQRRAGRCGSGFAVACALTAVSAGEAVVPASELAAGRAEVANLQRVRGKTTTEKEILKEAVE